MDLCEEIAWTQGLAGALTSLLTRLKADTPVALPLSNANALPVEKANSKVPLPWVIVSCVLLALMYARLSAA